MNINKHIIIIAKYRSTKKTNSLFYIFFSPCKNRGYLKIRYWYKHIEKYLYVINTVMQVWLWILTSQVQDFKSCVQCVHSEKQNIVAQKINQEQKPTWKNNQKIRYAFKDILPPKSLNQARHEKWSQIQIHQENLKYDRWNNWKNTQICISSADRPENWWALAWKTFTPVLFEQDVMHFPFPFLRGSRASWQWRIL